MSPSSREVAINKPLSGAELRTILRAKCEELLDAEGLLSSHIAFGRVSYQLELRIHTGNMHMPESRTLVQSQDEPGGIIEKPPLTPQPPDGSVGAVALAHRITSPNAERIRHGLPVEVQTKTIEGSVERNKILFPNDPDKYPEAAGPGDVFIRDTTAQARQDWGVLDVQPPSPPVLPAPPTESASDPNAIQAAPQADRP